MSGFNMINSSKAMRSTASGISSPVKIGDILEVKLERMSFGPKAVGRWNSLVTSDSDDVAKARPFVVFVEGGAPGETVKVKVEGVEKSYCDASLVEVISASPLRTEAPCPYFGKCGGCQWQHLTYDAQLEAKKGVVLHQLARSSGQDLIAEIEADPTKLHIHGTKSTLGYRTRVQARFDGKNLGFFAANSKTFIPVESCVVAHPKIQARWKEFLQTNASPVKKFAQPAPAISEELKKVEWTLSDQGQVLEAWDEPHAAHGFTQIHGEQNLKLISIVRDLVHLAAGSSGADRSQPLCIVDLYAGNGNLTNALATEEGHTVIQVEAFQSAIQMNDDCNNIFKIQSHVDQFLQRWIKTGRVMRASEGPCPTPKLIIADPPREGLKQCVKNLGQLEVENLILVSCDPSTLARDLSTLTDCGYKVQQIHVLDMFPQTYHVETVLWLKRG